MLEKMKSNAFEYQKLSLAEQKARGILGRLAGPIADTKDPTRNERYYSDQLWENVFESPIMKEKIANRCCFGELGHPEDRTEIDMEKVAICLAEQPKKGKDGKLFGVFDILNTPNGRILKTLCDYGCNIGISSRGQGDIISINGRDEVDPDTYECECFDAVIIPAVESARMKYMTESLDTNARNMEKALCESLSNATEDEKKVMKETLKELNINLVESSNDDNEPKSDDNHEELASEFIDEINNGMISEIKDETKEEVEEENSDKVAEIETEDKVEDNKEDSAEDNKEDVEDAAVEDVSVEDTSEDASEENTGEENAATDETDNNEDLDVEVSEDNLSEDEEEKAFFDFLNSHFNPEQVKKACEILGFECENTDAAEPVADVDVEVTAEVLPAEENEYNDESRVDKDEETSEEDVEEKVEADNVGDTELLDTLKEALRSKSALEDEIRSLQEKLAVSDTKVKDLNEECDKYKQSNARLAVLAKSGKDVKENAIKLEESLKEKDELIESQKARIARLVKARKENLEESVTLTESVSSKDSKITELNESLSKVTEETSKQISVLTEKLETTTKDFSDKVNKLTEDLNKATTIKESYKKLANKAVDKYIEVKANMIGMTSKDIKRKLGETYTLSDVDQVCEDLKAYQLNISKLPFSIDRKVGVRVNESTASTVLGKQKFEDDDVDDDLIKLANI